MIAINKAKSKIASDIKSELTTSIDIYAEQMREDKTESFAESYANAIGVTVKASLEEIETICSKLTKNNRTDEYTAYVTIQVARNNVMANVRKRLNNRTQK